MGRQNVNKWILILSGFQNCMLVLEQSHGNLNNHKQVLVMAFVSFLIQKLAFYQPSNSLNIDTLLIVVKQCIIYSISSSTSVPITFIPSWLSNATHHISIAQVSVSLCSWMIKKTNQEILWCRKKIGKVTERKTIQSVLPLGCLESYKKILFERW